MILKSVIILICLCEQSFERKVKIFMPNVQPTEHDQHLGIVHTFNDGEVNYLADIEWKVDSESIHHIAILTSNELPDRYLKGIFESKVIYQEIIGIKSLTFIGSGRLNKILFKNSKGYGVLLKKYFIMDIHYNNVTRYRNGDTDNSGVILTVVPKVETQVELLILSARGSIGPHQTDCLDLYFHIEQPIVMRILFITFHTHSLGRVGSSYIVRNGTWTLIDKGDPVSLQNFQYLTEKNLTAKEGDFIAIRCIYVNDRDTSTHTGKGVMNEMCSHVIYYTVDEGNYLDISIYTSSRRWKDDNRVIVPEWVDRESRELSD